MSAVDQGYHYAINLPCDWIIVTSIRQTRLYFKGADQYTYERFDTEKLAADDSLLKKFIFLLAAERVVPLVGRCHLYALAGGIRQGGKRTDQAVLPPIRQHASRMPSPGSATRTRIPRLTMSCDLPRSCWTAFSSAPFARSAVFCPPDTIAQAYKHRDPYRPRPIWDNFQGLFHAINEGNAELNIPAYNGGLFADDAVLDSLQVPDEVCGYFRDLGEYDYRPAHEAAADTEGGSTRTLIDVDILGHIFEQSITDLEKIRNELDDLAERRPAWLRTQVAAEEGGGVLHAVLHHAVQRAASPWRRSQRSL